MELTDRDRPILDYILAFGRRAEYVVSHGKDAYDSGLPLQEIAQLACIRMGEAAKRLSPDLVAARPEIQFRPMMKLRDVVVHRLDLDLETIWNAIANSIPAEMARIQALLAAHELAEAQRMREHANQESRQADAADDIAQHSPGPEEQERAAAEAQQREAHAAWARGDERVWYDSAEKRLAANPPNPAVDQQRVAGQKRIPPRSQPQPIPGVVPGKPAAVPDPRVRGARTTTKARRDRSR